MYCSKESVRYKNCYGEDTELEKKKPNFLSEISAFLCLKVLQVIWSPNPSDAVSDEPRVILG